MRCTRLCLIAAFLGCASATSCGHHFDFHDAYQESERLEQAGNYADAAKLWQQCVDDSAVSRSTKSSCYNNLGVAKDHLGELTFAQQAYERSIELDWSDPLPYTNAAKVSRRIGRSADAANFDRDASILQEANQAAKPFLQYDDKVRAAAARIKVFQERGKSQWASLERSKLQQERIQEQRDEEDAAADAASGAAYRQQQQDLMQQQVERSQELLQRALQMRNAH